MTERFLSKRIRNIMGDSELDDAVSAKLIQYMEVQIEALLTIADPRAISYAQGQIAALNYAIQQVRENNKRKLTQEEEE